MLYCSKMCLSSHDFRGIGLNISIFCIQSLKPHILLEEKDLVRQAESLEKKVGQYSGNCNIPSVWVNSVFDFAAFLL